MFRGNNYAFIDGQNVYRGIKRMGWTLDWRRFRVYLQEKYNVSKAYVFIGYMESNIKLYKELERAGFILIFKPVLYDSNGHPKGNVDADLVLNAILAKESYGKAVIVSGDGDYYSLVEHLYLSNKLCCVMSPDVSTCSALLKRSAKEFLVFMSTLQNKLKRKGTA